MVARPECDLTRARWDAEKAERKPENDMGAMDQGGVAGEHDRPQEAMVCPTKS